MFSMYKLIIYVGLILFDNISLVDVLVFTRIIQTIEQTSETNNRLFYILVPTSIERNYLYTFYYDCFILRPSYVKIIYENLRINKYNSNLKT